MFAYVFVYSKSTFKVGANPLVRFVAGGSYGETGSAIAGGGEGVIDRGIYVINGEAVDMEPEIYAMGAQATVDYDQLSATGKDDDWPWLVDPERSVNQAMRERAIAVFPTLSDEDLRQFVLPIARGV